MGLAASAGAQSSMDTICVTAGPSHFAVPHVAGQVYHWQVSGGQIISKPDSNDIRVVWGNVPGIYRVSVVVTSEHGCPGDTSSYYINLRGPSFANAKGPTQVCSGSVVKLESAIAGDFMWGGGQTTRSLSFTADKDTSIALIALNAPCANDTFIYQLQVFESPSAGMNYIPDTVTINTIENLYYTGATGSPEIEWFYNGMSVSTRSAVQIEFNRKGEHEIVQVVRKGSCTDTIYQWVYVEDMFKIFIPNAFTPNGDGVNDYFTFDGVGIQSFQAEIYNRWGERLFEWNDNTPVQGWDGTKNGHESKIDAYIYKIRVRDMAGETHFYTNQFSLLR